VYSTADRNRGHDVYPGSGLRRVIPYIVLVTMVAQMRSGRGGRSHEACASLCVWRERGFVQDQMPIPSWPPLLALIWEARSQDPVQVGYEP
jgi:hypothetical protein